MDISELTSVKKRDKPIKLTRAGITEFRNKLLRENKNTCEICKKLIGARDRAVLDHCHVTNRVRGVIHSSCNAAEGKIRVKAKWSHKGVSSTDYLIGLGRYLNKYNIKPRQVFR